MNSSSVIALMGLSFVLASCATRLSCDSGAPRLPLVRPEPLRAGTQAARVTGYVAGCTQGGFTITEVTKVRYLPSCGMDIMAAAFTLGLVPYTAPQPVQATVVGRCDGRTVMRTYRLPIERHTSLWHSLVPGGHDDRAIARAVLQAINGGWEQPPIGEPTTTRGTETGKH